MTLRRAIINFDLKQFLKNYVLVMRSVVDRFREDNINRQKRLHWFFIGHSVHQNT